jgi:hypothetical protein
LIKRNNPVEEPKNSNTTNTTNTTNTSNTINTSNIFKENDVLNYNNGIKEEMKKNYNFDYFKQRNKEIYSSSNSRSTSNADTKKKNNPTDTEKKENFIDEKTLAKLQEFIKQDDLSKDKYKTINNTPNDNNNPNFVEEGFENEEKELLVNRPVKNFVWGLGNQTKQKKCIEL